MLVAAVHAGGAETARKLVERAYRITGEPHLVASRGDGFVAGWRSSAALSLVEDGMVQGWLDGPTNESRIGSNFDECLAGARGDFALLAFVAGGLLAASGPGGGHRPLFVATRAQWAAASTRLRLLLSLMGERPPLDLDYLAASTVINAPISRSATPYQGVHHVPLGEAWLLSVGRPERRRSTLLHLPGPAAPGSDDDNARRLRHTIERAVVRGTRGATKVGVTLSGGLDSSAVMATLQSLRRAGRVSTDVEAFSWEFETPDPGDDRPFRRSMERRLGIRSKRISPEQAAPFVRSGMVLDAMPCTDCPSPLWIALDRAAHGDGIHRILTGAGGDNVLDGDPTLLGELARRGSPGEALKRALRFRIGHTSAWWRVRTFVLRPAVRAATPEPLRALHRRRRERRWFDWMGPRYDEWLEARTAGHSAEMAPLSLDSSAGERYVALARMPFLADVALLRAQQEEATHYHRSDPLFDDEVLRVVASLPPLALLAGDCPRGLLRQSMSDLLPEDVRTRRRKAYLDPALVRMVVAAGGFAPFEDLARVRRLADLGLVEPKAFRKHFDRMASYSLDGVWSSAWPALAVEEFLRQYDEGWQA